MIAQKKWADVVSVINGKNQKNVADSNGKYPIYGSGGIIGRANDYLCEAGTTIIGRKGTINSPIFVDQNFWNVDTAFGISPHDELIPKYLFYFCQSFNFKTLDKSTTIPSLAKRDLLQISMPVPPLSEQERIVAHIEELFSELDAGVETLKKTKAQLDVYRQAVLKEAFEGHLTKSKQVSASVLSEFIEKPHYGTSKKCTYENNSYKAVYRIPNINHAIGRISKDDIKYAQFTQTELQNIELHNGDLLIIRSNGSINLVGRAAIIYESDTDATFAGYLMRLRINDPSILNPFFLLHYLQSHSARIYIESKAKSTSGVHNINSQEISQLPIPLYKIEDQKKIVAEIESRLSVCNNIEQTIDAALDQAKALRHSILKEAFEGKM